MALTELEHQITDRIIRREGGLVFTCNPGDRGGETAAGVIYETYARWCGDNPITRDEFRAEGEKMSPEFVASLRECYADLFIRPFGWVSPVALRIAVIDAGVNCGVRAATKMLQRAVGSAPDGLAGANTKAALRSSVQRHNGLTTTVLEITRERCEHYARLVKRDQTQVKWLRGWLRRSLDVAMEALI